MAISEDRISLCRDPGPPRGLVRQATFLRRSIRVTFNSRSVRVRRRRTSASCSFDRLLLIAWPAQPPRTTPVAMHE